MGFAMALPQAPVVPELAIRDRCHCLNTSTRGCLTRRCSGRAPQGRRRAKLMGAPLSADALASTRVYESDIKMKCTVAAMVDHLRSLLFFRYLDALGSLSKLLGASSQALLLSHGPRGISSKSSHPLVLLCHPRIASILLACPKSDYLRTLLPRRLCPGRPLGRGSLTLVRRPCRYQARPISELFWANPRVQCTHEGSG